MNLKNLMNGMFVTFCLVIFSQSAFAGKPVCQSTYGGYCAYTGKVKTLYVNSANIILLYFDTAIPTNETAIAGITVTNGSATAFDITENPEFANYFYSTALAAQASGRNVTIQMRGSQSGYLRFDRIWLAQ